MMCVYSHLIIFHELYGFGVSRKMWHCVHVFACSIVAKKSTSVKAYILHHKNLYIFVNLVF